MKTFQQLLEGIYDPNIFKAVFLAGGPGSGKSYVVSKVVSGMGLKVINSDEPFERYLVKAGLSLKMPDEEQAEKLKKAQSLYQDIQFLTQKMQTLENEIVQKLQADQGPNVQKVVNDLIVAKKITLLFNSQALLAYDRTNPLINITPEVIELLNQANSKD